MTPKPVRRVVAGSTIELRCDGHGCPFKHRRTTVRSDRAVVSVLGTLRTAKLARGATVTVRVTKPGFTGAMRRFVVRGPATAPRITEGCLAAQSGKPIKC